MVLHTAREVDRIQDTGLIRAILLFHKKTMGSHLSASRKYDDIYVEK